MSALPTEVKGRMLWPLIQGGSKFFTLELRSSLLTLGIADASIAGFRREWGLTPLCEAAATFSGYSEGLSRLSLNRSLHSSLFTYIIFSSTFIAPSFLMASTNFR
jgi:hypothetical protein